MSISNALNLSFGVNQLIFANTSTNLVGLTTANNGVLITSAGGVPSISSTLPSGITLVAPILGTPVSGTLTNCTGLPLTTGVTGILPGANGGTGVANTGFTFTMGGNVAFSGAYTFTGTLTGNTSVTFPTSGTLATTSGASIPAIAQGDLLYGSGINTLAALSKDTNATRYLSNTGASNNPAWAQINLANGVTGQLPLANGGLNANLTASNGGIFYSTGTAGAILAGTATAGQLLLSGSSTTPSWSTSTYPSTNAINTLLYASSANVMSALATANNGVLITSAGGVPSISSTLPANLTLVTPTLGVATATSISFGGTALSTYVENTWTPVFTSDGGGTATYAVQAARYSRIGNRVFINATIVLSGLPSAGNVSITGLPVAAGATYYSSLAVWGNTFAAGVTSPVTALIVPSASEITLHTWAAGSSTQLTVGGCQASTAIVISGEYTV